MSIDFPTNRTKRQSAMVAMVALISLFVASAAVLAQEPIYVSVRTNSGNDTLVANTYGIIHFSIDSGNTEALRSVSWPLQMSFTNGNILGPLADTGSPRNVGFVPWNGPTDNFFEESPGGPNSITILASSLRTAAPFGIAFAEQWRINVTPSDTGQITIDTLSAITATDSNGASIPVVWQPATITVLPYCPAGDLNGDGLLNAADVFILRRFIQQSGPPPDVCIAHADVNCGGSMDPLDIIALLHFLYVGDQSLCYTCGLIEQGVWTCDALGP